MPDASRPNPLVILIDDLRFDEFGAGGHPYMRTPTWTASPARARCASGRSHTPRGMTYKAERTERAKLIHRVSRAGWTSCTTSPRIPTSW